MLPDNEQTQQDQPLSRQDFLGLLGALGAGVGATAITTQTTLAAKPGQLDPPVLNFVESTRISVEIEVTAGASGAPGGFAIRWINSADNRQESATFSGIPSGSNFALQPNQSAKVKIGDLFFDEGVSTTNPFALKPVGEYRFTAIALPTKGNKQSEPSLELIAGPLIPPPECPTPPNCTANLAFWKSNGPGICSANSGPNLWPTDTLKLGNNTYDASSLCVILLRKAGEFDCNAMAQQLIAAKLNVARGADPTVIAAHIEAADLLIGDLTLPANGKDAFPTEQTFAQVIALSNYNEGATGPQRCC
jgi:hypothetical protein